MKTFKVGIIGFGNIGKKRFLAINKIKKYNIEVVYIVDKFLKKKNAPKRIKFFNDWKKTRLIEVDLIVISTPTKVSEYIAKELAGKYNLLIEKPITTKLKLFSKILIKSNNNKVILKSGYNLRFDDGLTVAKNILDKKKIGKIYYCKITYANGAAKTNSNQVGSLIDMGAHSINLIQWLFKNSKIKPIYKFNQANEFMNKKKTDNGFIMLKFDKAICVLHHGFCTWKNKFNLEISGSRGYINVSSLSKWKNQKVSYGIRKYPSGFPLIKEWTFKLDNSWRKELIFVIKKILNKNLNYKSINYEGYNTLKLIKKIS